MIVCDDNDKRCIYRESDQCKNKTIDFKLIEEEGRQVTWHAWKTKREKIADWSSKRIVTKTVKEQEQGTRTVSAEIITELQRVGQHICNTRNQYKVLHHLEHDLKDDKVIAYVDFFENYTCKYAKEIQSMHGGSRRLLSLHTEILYTNEGTTTFCSVSDCMRHDPAAIWAHMHPVLITYKHYRNEQSYMYTLLAMGLPLSIETRTISTCEVGS